MDECGHAASSTSICNASKCVRRASQTDPGSDARVFGIWRDSPNGARRRLSLDRREFARRCRSHRPPLVLRRTGSTELRVPLPSPLLPANKYKPCDGAFKYRAKADGNRHWLAPASLARKRCWPRVPTRDLGEVSGRPTATLDVRQCGSNARTASCRVKAPLTDTLQPQRGRARSRCRAPDVALRRLASRLGAPSAVLECVGETVVAAPRSTRQFMAVHTRGGPRGSRVALGPVIAPGLAPAPARRSPATRCAFNLGSRGSDTVGWHGVSDLDQGREAGQTVG